MDVFVKKEDTATVSPVKYIPCDVNLVQFLLNRAHFTKTDLDMNISIDPNIQTNNKEKEWLITNKRHYLRSEEIKQMLFKLSDVKEEDESENVEKNESESLKEEEDMYEIEEKDVSNMWLNEPNIDETTLLVENKSKDEQLSEPTNIDCKKKKSKNRNLKNVKCPECDYSHGRSDNVRRHILNIHAETRKVRVIEHLSQEKIDKLQIKYNNSCSKKIINYDKISNLSQKAFNKFIDSFNNEFIMVLLSSSTIFHALPKPYVFKKPLSTNSNDAKNCFFARNKFDQFTKCRVKQIINENKKKYEGNDRNTLFTLLNLRLEEIKLLSFVVKRLIEIAHSITYNHTILTTHKVSMNSKKRTKKSVQMLPNVYQIKITDFKSIFNYFDTVSSLNFNHIFNAHCRIRDGGRLSSVYAYYDIAAFSRIVHQLDLVNQINFARNLVDGSIKWPKIVNYFKRLQKFIYFSNPSEDVILKPYIFYSTLRYKVHPILIVHMLSEFIHNANNDPALLHTTNFTSYECKDLLHLLTDKDLKNEELKNFYISTKSVNVKKVKSCKKRTSKTFKNMQFEKETIKRDKHIEQIYEFTSLTCAEYKDKKIKERAPIYVEYGSKGKQPKNVFTEEISTFFAKSYATDNSDFISKEIFQEQNTINKRNLSEHLPNYARFKMDSDKTALDRQYENDVLKSKLKNHFDNELKKKYETWYDFAKRLIEMLSHINKFDQSKSQNELAKNTLIYEKIQQEVIYGPDKKKYPKDAFKKIFTCFKFSNSILKSCKKFDEFLDHEKQEEKISYLSKDNFESWVDFGKRVFDATEYLMYFTIRNQRAGQKIKKEMSTISNSKSIFTKRAMHVFNQTKLFQNDCIKACNMIDIYLLNEHDDNYDHYHNGKFGVYDEKNKFKNKYVTICDKKSVIEATDIVDVVFEAAWTRVASRDV